MRYGFPWRESVALVSFFFLSSGFSSARAAGTCDPLRVLQLNFNRAEIMNPSSSATMSQLRYVGMTDWVRANEPDIAFLEGAWNFNSDPSIAVTLSHTLGYDLEYRIVMGTPFFYLDSDAILARPEFQLRNTHEIKLPRSADQIGDGKTWILTDGPVSYLVGATITMADGQPAYVYVTHLMGANDQQRTEQSKAIARDIREQAAADGIDWTQARVILGGDFNSAPGDGGPTYLMEQGYADAFAVNHPGDTSCSNCSDPTADYFNPTTVGFGLDPSQNGEDGGTRSDFIFTQGPGVTPLASTLVFTQPHGGAWMSDHYGILSVLGTPSPRQTLPNPVHDSEKNAIPDPQILALGDEAFVCDNGSDCVNPMPDTYALGSRGIVFMNSADFPVRIEISGPASIFTGSSGELQPGQQVAFTFGGTGSFSYTIRNEHSFLSPYPGSLSGTTHVVNTGY